MTIRAFFAGFLSDDSASITDVKDITMGAVLTTRTDMAAKIRTRKTRAAMMTALPEGNAKLMAGV